MNPPKNFKNFYGIRSLEEMPRNAMGKVNKKELIKSVFVREK